MSTKLTITLKNSGKTIELYIEGAIRQADMSSPDQEGKWFIRNGFELHPFKSPKVIVLRSDEIAGIEITQSDDWTANGAKAFKESLS